MQEQPHTAPADAHGNDLTKVVAWCVAGLIAGTVFFGVLRYLLGGHAG